MSIKRSFLLLLIFVFYATTMYSQKGGRPPKKDKFEFGLFLGASNYEGDLTDGIANLNSTEIAFGGMLRYNINNKFSLRVGMDYGTISDADSLSTSSYRQRRNLSFRTTIIDQYVVAEYYFANWSVGYKKFLSPYIFAGVGSFTFDPKAEYQGTWYDLQPLGTEGQGTLAYPDRQPYPLTQVYIPFGGGLRLNLGTFWSLSLECRVNKTFTDYLDDVSKTYAATDVLEAQGGPLAVALAFRSDEKYPNTKFVEGATRGNPKSDDWFFFTGITIARSLKAKSHCYSF